MSDYPQDLLDEYVTPRDRYNVTGRLPAMTPLLSCGLSVIAALTSFEHSLEMAAK
jgi:hypothetical protein